ncbi:hypothetical protein RXV86_04360 [Alisedimentitalea sp. MJ-SS2]|uniref:hypothetical protein n=1 Tax=Aliisedimentitalea sp. MJ-SS2 TaxID=3049795 RepID=UPI002908FB1E|nr:hypothetical protein [Alisedimentitalea sp. MJ-SS2]MDU8926611.1 hypothetical protein [Alisedimentitalea sp. MJ-SS2]
MHRITTLSTATALFALTGTNALAECPTGSDKKDGITLAQNTPFFMRSDFKSTPDGFVEQRVMEVGSATRSTMALCRHGLVMSGEHSPSGHVEITFIEAETRQVGECSFEVWNVTSSLKDRGGTGAVFLMAYAPELDLVLAASATDADGNQTPVYAYQWAGKTAEIGE